MKKHSLNIIGLILIAIGIFILSDNFLRISNDLLVSVGLLATGLAGMVLGLRSEPPKLIFISAILLFVGTYLTMGYFDVIEIRRGLSIAVLPVSLAIGFIASYVLAAKKPEKLLFALFFGAIGASFLGVHYGYIPDHVFVNWVDDYWPLTMIFAGIALLVSGIARSRNKSTVVTNTKRNAAEEVIS